MPRKKLQPGKIYKWKDLDTLGLTPVKIEKFAAEQDKTIKRITVNFFLCAFLFIASIALNFFQIEDIEKQKEEIKSLQYQVIGETASAAFWKRERDLRKADFLEMQDYAWKLKYRLRKANGGTRQGKH